MTFEEFNFHPDLMRGVRDMRYENPTPVQQQSIPPAMEGKDVIANAQTGSGKTAAFLLPLMHRIMDLPEGKTRVLVLAPTRELAVQIDEQALGFGYHTHLRSACVYGGVRMELQEQALKDGTSIIAATPGRLLDHHKYGSWRFDELTAVVLDEADRMLDMGFWPDIQAIMAKLPPTKQFLLFSATMPQPIVDLAKTFMKDPVHIKIAIAKPPSTINQVFYPVDAHDKLKLLGELMKQMDMKSTIIFVSTKIGADRLFRALNERGLPVGVIHGDREQADRDKVLLDFRSGKVQILVATDVASRGIDVDGISHVINFDMPPDPDSYVHRIGRTARAGESGEALSFITAEDAERVRAIEEIIGKEIPRKVVPGFETSPRPSRQESHRGGRSSGGFAPQGHRPGSGPRRHDGPRSQGPSGQWGSRPQGSRSGGPRHEDRRPQGGPSRQGQGPGSGYGGNSGGMNPGRPTRPAREQGPSSASEHRQGSRSGGSSRRHSEGPNSHRGPSQRPHRDEHRGGGQRSQPHPSSGAPASHSKDSAAPKKKKPFWWPF